MRGRPGIPGRTAQIGYGGQYRTARKCAPDLPCSRLVIKHQRERKIQTAIAVVRTAVVLTTSLTSRAILRMVFIHQRHGFRMDAHEPATRTERSHQHGKRQGQSDGSGGTMQ